ncbi:MAG: arsenite S-adenosylmethyltransferase, partial [Deltaproteobacteria bacterium]|nr:arsenite S-adenosylmethyltransferase [Deltaproteobacteria bacterium]
MRDRYGSIARKESSCCGAASSCGEPGPAEDVSRRIGYSEEELGFVPQGANLGLGCGNPTA